MVFSVQQSTANGVRSYMNYFTILIYKMRGFLSPLIPRIFPSCALYADITFPAGLAGFYSG